MLDNKGHFVVPVTQKWLFSCGYEVKQPKLMFSDNLMEFLISDGDIWSPISLKTKEQD